MHAIGMAITTVALVTAVLSVGLYVSMAGSTVNIPAGLYSVSASRTYYGPSHGMERHFTKKPESYIGPSGRCSVIPFEYPFLPVKAEIYKCTTPDDGT